MQHSRFRNDDDRLGRRVFAERHHLFGRTNFIGEHTHGRGAFRMGNEWRTGVLFPNLANAARRELDVDVTGPPPQIHFAAGPFHNPRAEVLVRHEENVAIGWRGLHDFLRIAARANDIALRFHSGAAIDVGYNVIVLIRVLLQESRERLWRAGFRERAASIQIWQNDPLGRINNLRRLSHEMDAAKENHVCIRFRRLVAQPERVADEIRDILKLRDLIIVRQNDGVTFPL